MSSQPFGGLEIMLKLCKGWIRESARQRYEKIAAHLRSGSLGDAPYPEGVETLATAELNIILGKPLSGLALLKTQPLPSTLHAARRILQAKALHSMRLSEAAAYLLHYSIETESLHNSYEVCLELARVNYYLACNSRDAHRVKSDIEAAVSTVRHCIKLSPDKPDAYALLARITAPYPHATHISDDAYERFMITLDNPARLKWGAAADITYTHWLRGRVNEMSSWREQWVEIVEANLWDVQQVPFNPDRFTFSALAEIYRLAGIHEKFEEYLQTSFLLYPTKTANLVKHYLRRLHLRKFICSLAWFLTSADKQEASLRYTYARSGALDKKRLIFELIGF